MSSPPQSPPPYQRPSFHVARHAAKAEQRALDRDDLEPPVPPEIHRPAIAIRIVVSVVVLIGIGVVAALGGFERDPDAYAGPPIVKVGEKVQAGIWEVTIDGAKTGTNLRAQRVDQGFQIEIDITLTNNSDRTRYANDIIVLQGVDGLEVENPFGPNIVGLRDDRLNSHVQPGLPEKFALIWKVKPGSPRPKELRVEIVGIHPRISALGLLNDLFDAKHVDGVATIPVAS